MRMANGCERLVAAKVGMGTMEVVAQQDLPALMPARQQARQPNPGRSPCGEAAGEQAGHERTSDVLLIGPQPQQPALAAGDHGR